MPPVTLPTSPLTVATWNVNSIRSRVERVVGFLQRSDVDVLLIQETKVATGAFPRGPIEALGYEVVSHGLNQWNGVAIASRVGLDEVEIGLPDLPEYGEPPVAEARMLSADCGGVRVTSVYVPNGREIDHPHYHYKLAWLAALRDDLSRRLQDDPQAHLLLGGDFNIAPVDSDVWSMEFYANSTHVTPPERQAFQALLDVGMVDVVRPYTCTPGTYTYWDYQQLRFPKNRGMRIDFLLASPALAGQVADARIDREERKGTGASDHAPVLATFALPHGAQG